jgi:polyhydroxyalkanoate synthesis regulator phasin
VILRGPDEKSQVAKRRTYLGVYSMPNDEGSLVIRDVIPDTPAERAGLKRNDVILSFAGKTPKTSEELAADIRSRKPGEKVEVRIRREGNEMALAIPLGEAPEDEVIAQGVMPVTPGQHDLWVKEGESFVAKGDLAERNKELAAQAREMAAQQREMAKEMATQQREMAKDIAAQQREFTKRQEREVAELHKQVADLQAQLSKLSSELASMRDLIAKLKQQQR